MMDEASDEPTTVGDLVGEEAMGHKGLVDGVNRGAVVLLGDGVV